MSHENLQHRLERLKAQVMSREQELASPHVLSDPKLLRKANQALKELAPQLEAVTRLLALEKEHEEARTMAEDGGLDAELRQMAQEDLPRLEEDLTAAREHLLDLDTPRDPDDEKSAILEIRAGTGGEEAALFAQALFRMYARYAENKGWRVETTSASYTELGGLKEIVFLLEGQGVWRLLKYEGGTHRVQRIPVTESGGRIHTSAVTVAVLPEADDDAEVNVLSKDLRVDTYRASGAGGQHVNKTESAIRITHLPTGIVVQCQDERSQLQNREKAMKMLRSYLLEHQRTQADAEHNSLRRTQVGSGDRSERIRTYNYPQNRLTDHRINLTLYSLDRILEGDLEPVVMPLGQKELEEIRAKL